MNFTIISGSPRGNSVTYRVALHLEQQFRQRIDCEINIIDMREIEFPQLEKVFTSVEDAPNEYKPVARIIFKTDAFILVTPEYNGSYSAPMKNLLDHFPKQHRKAFGIVTASTGMLGGIRAALQLQALVFALLGIGSPYMLVTPQVDKKFDTNGNLIDEKFKKSVEVFVNEFIWLAERIVGEKVNG